nr:PAS domain S-box protein [uncultured Arsenicibacter sp.]
MAQAGYDTDNEERMRFALESAGMGIWDLDPVNQVIHWDERCQQLYGFSKHDTITYSEVLKHIHPQDQHKVDNAVKQALNPASDGIYYCVFRTIGAEDNKLRWLRCQGKVYFDSQHNPYRFAGTAIDITEEINTKNLLAESETRFVNMIEQAPVAVGVLRGEQLVIESANDMLLMLWGKTRAVIGLPLLAGLPELIGQPFPGILADVYNTGIAYNGSNSRGFLMRNNQLEEAYFNFVYSPLSHSSQTNRGIMVIAYEVTTQVNSRKELAESELRFKTLIDEAPIATAVYLGKDMVIQLANEAMLKVWGKQADVIGKKLADALPELDGQPFHDLLASVYETGVPYQAEEDRADLVVDGKLQSFYFNFTYKPLRNTSGEIYAILNMAVDVTNLVHNRRKTRQAEEQLRTAIEAAQLGTWRVNIPERKAYFSERLRQWFGFEQASIDPKAGVMAIHPKDRNRFIEKARQTLDPQAGGYYEDEYTIVHLETRQERVVRSVGRVFFNDDRIPYLIIGTVQDITAQKMAEQELERLVQQRTEQLRKLNVNLQQSNQELERFAYVASHDMQEPLRKIQSFSSLLQAEYADKLGESGRQLLDRVEASASRMSLLIKDILNFSRMTQQDHPMQRVDLNQTVRDVMSDLELLIAEKGGQVTFSDLCTIDAVPLQMYQLFYNLISNSLKFSQTGIAPVITIRSTILPGLPETGETGLDTANGEEYCDIQVTDNGIGFNPKYARQIFGLFQRLHSKAKYDGTGIGLALCQRIVANHTGRISAHSEEGKGATFRIALPCRHA